MAFISLTRALDAYFFFPLLSPFLSLCDDTASSLLL